MRFFLSGYTIRVFKINKDKTKDIFKLDQLLNKHDFFNIFDDFLKTLSNNGVIDNNQKSILQTRNINADKNQRIITATVDSGIYGINSKLIDVNTRKTSYIRNQCDAETLPFYFMIFLPEKRDKGILLLESIGKYEMKKHLAETLRDYMTKKYFDISFEICKLIPGKIIEKLLSKSRTTKIRLIKYNIPNDIFDALDEPHKEKDLTIKREVIYSSTNLSIQDMIRKIMNKEKSVNELFELKEIKENDYDKLKFELKIGSITKTIDLDNLTEINNSIDITDDLKINVETGYPNIDSLEFTFQSYLEYFRQEMDGK